VFVPVTLVKGVAVTVMNVIDVVAVLHGGVAAVVAVLVIVLGVGLVKRSRVALVPMIVMGVVGVTIVEIVDVAGVLDGGVPAGGAVVVVVIGVRGVVGHGHGGSPRTGQRLAVS